MTEEEMVGWHHCLSGCESEVAQSCPTLCDPMDCSLSGSPAHGILQARVREWIAISFSRGSSQARNRTRSPALQADALLSEFREMVKDRKAWLAGSPRGRKQSDTTEQQLAHGSYSPPLSFPACLASGGGAKHVGR